MLENKKCIPCQGGIPPLNKQQIESLIKHIDSDWDVNNEIELVKEYKFDIYLDAVKFLNLVTDLAENEGHHPYIHLNYKLVKIILFTHKINGLHENDFIMAKKIDNLNSKS
ncbi:MAG: 4a-hydroxytetrahydrobiopterin dehydratase [Flavobacteriales bacterium]|nr:4a-hydroxytetrahydrobiopterin dehydratase [Flavobacteriales bacterium]|tara:strand:- start:588 stop:920 length:333 start_codon:yes stop_codon:yes gene_type:complete